MQRTLSVSPVTPTRKCPHYGFVSEATFCGSVSQFKYSSSSVRPDPVLI